MRSSNILFKRVSQSSKQMNYTTKKIDYDYLVMIGLIFVYLTSSTYITETEETKRHRIELDKKQTELEKETASRAPLRLQ